MKKVLPLIALCLLIYKPAHAAVSHYTVQNDDGTCTSHWIGDDQDNVLGTATDPCRYAVFDGGLGADTFNTGPFVQQATYIYHSLEESQPCCGATPEYDKILHWHAGDIIDVSDICHVEFQYACSLDPVADDANDHTDGKHYFWYLPIPVPPYWFTAIWGNYGTLNHFDFYIDVEGGRLPLTGANFYFGSSHP